MKPRRHLLPASAVIHLALPALIQAKQHPPRREVNDPGVVATGRRVTPAGVQSVFTGRVAGVRFGRSSDEVWVATPGSTYRMNWRANGVTARVRLDGTPGVHGIALDPASRRIFVSSVGRLHATSSTPGAKPVREPALTYLSGISGDVSRDSAAPALRSPALRDLMAGAPAIAAKAGPN